MHPLEGLGTCTMVYLIVIDQDLCDAFCLFFWVVGLNMGLFLRRCCCSAANPR